MLKLDHIGVSVPDLDEAVDWWTEALGAEVSWIEAPVNVNAYHIGLQGEAKVRLRGAVLKIGDAWLELHEFLTPTGGAALRRTCDLGLGHFAMAADDPDDLVAEYRRLADLGVQWYGEPRRIDHGGMVGHWWVYGETPSGVMLQLCWHPPPPEIGLTPLFRTSAGERTASV